MDVALYNRTTVSKVSKMQNDNIEKARKSWSESLDKDVFQVVDNLDD